MPSPAESLNKQVMNDPSIPFIRQYGEWSVLDAARRTAAGWRQQRYGDHSKEVPENRRYLAANSAKRNPSAPRGARFPARPSKRDRTPTPDRSNDDDSNDRRIPVLPSGPSTSGNWNPGPPPNRPIHPVTSPLQLSFNGFGTSPQTQASLAPSFTSWGQRRQQSFCAPGTSTSVNYWESNPPGM